MASWTREDVAATARAHPDSFFIPKESERIGIPSGETVRLHFVLEVRYRGVLTNQPAFIKDLRVGAQVAFGPEHVARLLLSESHPDSLEIGELKALVSAAALEEGRCVRWAYREKPDRDIDSGWRLFAGGETDEFNDNPRNIRPYAVYWLVDRDPSLHEVFRGEIGDAFERAEPRSAVVRVDDWSPPSG